MPEKLKTFEEYLLYTAKTPSKYVQHYLRWVEQFQESDAAVCADRQQALQEFQSLLNQRYESWQVKQACNAVRHFWFWLDQWRYKASPGAVSNREATHLIAEARQILRLQHKSYRTEQTYLGWIRRFLGFTQQVAPTKNQSDSLATLPVLSRRSTPCFGDYAAASLQCSSFSVPLRPAGSDRRPGGNDQSA
jgi:hypothetical protein